MPRARAQSDHVFLFFYGRQVIDDSFVFVVFFTRSVLGTPSEESWPGVKQLPDYKPTFPQWSPQDLAEQVPYLDSAGIDLLKVRFDRFSFLPLSFVIEWT